MRQPDPALIERFRGDLERLIGCPLGENERIGVAVSGGPDSMALLLLAHAAFADRVMAATVDHGIRAESRTEAEYVASACIDIGVTHEILGPIQIARQRASAQQRARAQRYFLLGGWAARHSIDWLATAHHADDQAETFLMRAARGAGLSGLCGIRPITGDLSLPPCGKVEILRPLLRWRRSELARIVKAAGVGAVSDPSNRNPAYDRTRFRELLAEHGELLDASRIARCVEHLREADAALEYMTEIAWANGVEPDEAGSTFTLRNAPGLPREVRRRVAKEIIRRLQGKHELGHPCRGEAIDRLITGLDAGRTMTLGGVIASGGPVWTFGPAPPRRTG